MDNAQLLGSQTAKRGFANEDIIVNKFNAWQTDNDAREWLQILGYDLSQIEFVYAVKLHGYKADVQAQVTIKLKEVISCQNIQVKLVSNPKGFNQIDKRWLARYNDLWNIPQEILDLLRLYTGELAPKTYPNLRDKKKRRIFADEFTPQEQDTLLSWIRHNQSLIVSDILKGRGELAAEWMLVVQRLPNTMRWVLKPMNFCLNFFGNGEVLISPRGTIKIGKITMQRKGGDGGRPTANMLQFKINPAELFYI